MVAGVVVCLGAAVFVFNLMAHALWMSGHPVEGTGAAAEVWRRRADSWFGVLVVLLGVFAWCAWGVVKWRRSMLKRVRAWYTSRRGHPLRS